MKSYTRRQINDILRTMNREAIYRLCKDLTGRTDRPMVYQIVKQYAPTAKLRSAAMSIAYPGTRQSAVESMDQALKSAEYNRANARHLAAKRLREEIAHTRDNYTKVPMTDGTNLYFASPNYGLKDYNRAYMMPVRGNEKFCDLLLSISHRYF